MIIDKLTPEDRNYLELLIKNLSVDKRSLYMEQAVKYSNDPLIQEKFFKELVIRNEFGPVRIERYEQR